MCNMSNSNSNLEGGTKLCSLLLRPCVEPYEFAVHLHSAWSRNRGHPQNLAQEKDLNGTLCLLSAPCRKVCTMYLKWNSPSRWRFKRGPRPSPPSWVGGSNDSHHQAWPKFDPDRKSACSRPLQVCVTGGTGPRVNGVWACVFVWVAKGHVKVCVHLKALTQTWVNTQRTTSRLSDFELIRPLKVSVSKHVTHVCLELSSPSVKCFIHSWASYHSFLL